MVNDKAYVCNACRKTITYSRDNAGKTIACPFCGAVVKLKTVPDWTLTATHGSGGTGWRRLFFVVVLVALAVLGVWLFIRKPVLNVPPAVHQKDNTWNLLPTPKPSVAPAPVWARGVRATLAVPEVVYGCPDIYQESLNRSSVAQTPVCCVKITITNTGKSILPFRTWRIFDSLSDQKRARLMDAAGNDYSLIADGVDSYPAGFLQQADLAPQEWLTDCVLFLCATKPDCDLELVLPCENIGGEGDVSFTIPRHLIR